MENSGKFNGLSIQIHGNKFTYSPRFIIHLSGIRTRAFPYSGRSATELTDVNDIEPGNELNLGLLMGRFMKKFCSDTRPYSSL